MLKKEELKNIDSKRMNEITYKIMDELREGPSVNPQKVFTAAYVEYVAVKNRINDVKELINYLETEVSEARALFVRHVLENVINDSFTIVSEFSEDELAMYLVTYPRESFGRVSSEYSTPDSVIKLAFKLLAPREKDVIADFGSGCGDFLVHAACENYTQLFGIDINTVSCEISKIRTEMLTNNVDIELGDMFAIPNESKYDKVFSNYPFGMRVLSLRNETEFIEAVNKKMPEMRKATSSDWIYNYLLTEHITDDGKAVAVMTNGSTWNSIDKRIREFFVRNGLIETVITLPSKLFDYTSISTTMMVFSKGNKTIRMINAENICEQGRRQNVITESDIERIMNLLAEDADEAVTVNLKTIQENDFVLNPSRYLDSPMKIEDGVKFGTVVKRITRGAPIKAQDLDQMVSEETTDTQYVMLANIQNGMISDELPYLKELSLKYDKYCIGNKNLLLSKNGAPFKVAVAEVEEGKKLLGNGNLFIIELDEEKVNPYFIKAFFDSEVGSLSLKSIAVGSAMPNISVESLKNLMVPLPPMEKQNEIATLYQAKIDEIKVLQLKIQKAQNELKGIFGEVE